MKHKKKLLLCIGITACCCFPITAQKTNVRAAYKLIERVLNTDSKKLPVKLSLKQMEHDSTYFSYKTEKGRLHITGNTPASLCRGLYDFLKTEDCGLYTWSGNNLKFPESLDKNVNKKIVSPFAHHYYFNVCTYGYSMPYWDWTRWEQEIDWMALHGIDMPLALVGYEAIIARVWKKMGLTEEEINQYFVGPAHLPWMRMGNVSGIDGPLNEDWHRQQIELQHKILKRMRELGMKPICPGFPGFIPQAFKRIHPELEMIETHWAGAFSNWMVSPQEPLFQEIGTAFIKEWEKEFGTCDYYLIDSFNEMDIPFPEKGNPERYQMAASYGEKVYESVHAANPKATWVMQGWMFGYQRYIWDYETLGALVSKVPDNKMLLLDLAVDYNKHFWHSEVNWEFYKGFYGKQWVYSVIPNMGGKVGMTGVLDFYANGHLEALASKNKGQLVAHGMAPEGIENNEVIYELVTDAGWSRQHIDLNQWLADYSQNRYGQTPETLMQSWNYLLQSCYGTFTDHPRFNWQFRPGRVKNGSINISEHYFKGLEQFAQAANELSSSSYYRNDLAEMTAHYLGGKAEILTKMIDEELLLGDTAQAIRLQQRFESLMLGMDSLLSQHPILRLDRWVGFASKAAVTSEQKKQYEKNARRIITIWGPPIDDYSARIWNGLIKDYYLERWKHYYQARLSKTEFDMDKWERNWVEQNHDPENQIAPFDIIPYAQEKIRQAQNITEKDLKLNRKNIISTWNTTSGQTKEFAWNLPPQKLKELNGISIELIKGTGTATIEGFTLEADGKTIASSDTKKTATNNQKATYTFSIPKDMNANNSCTLKIKISSSANCAGVISYPIK